MPLISEEYYLIRKSDYENLRCLYSELENVSLSMNYLSAMKIQPIVKDLRQIYNNIQTINDFKQTPEPNIDEKISIMNGRIDLLEMKVNRLLKKKDGE
jgi:predicted translin family RNA/ssDNA-binding protein